MLSQESFSRVVKMVKSHEGFRQFAYDDATGETVKAPVGKLTLGYGWNIQNNPCTKELGDIITQYFLKKTEAELANEYPYYLWLDASRKAVLLDMAYNLGVDGLLEFKHMLVAMQKQDWTLAGICQLDSDWARQVGSRALTLNHMLTTGEWHEV